MPINEPLPSPPTDYSTYVEIANGEASGRGFWWSNVPSPIVGNFDYIKFYINSNWHDHTYYTSYIEGNFLAVNSDFYKTRDDILQDNNILTLNIVSQNDLYFGSISNINPSSYFIDEYRSNNYYDHKRNFGLQKIGSNVKFLNRVLSSIGNMPSSISYSGTLIEVLSWFVYRFKNINIYVDC